MSRLSESTLSYVASSVNFLDYDWLIVYEWTKIPASTLSWNRFCIKLQPGPGHTSAGCVVWYMDQFGCVLVSVVFSWGRLTWIPGGRHSCHTSWDKRTDPAGSNPLRRGLVYRLAPEVTRFRVVPTGIKSFLEPPGVCGLRSCAWFKQKSACAILTRMWGARQISGSA